MVRKKHGSEVLDHAALAIDKHYDYLGLILDHSENESLLFDMMDYSNKMKECFPVKLEKSTKA